MTAETDETQNLQYAYNGDRLLAYGNETFVYDILGNPTVYRNKALVWEKGRQLKQYGAVTFEYDGRGQRIKKNTTLYCYAGNGNLLKQSDGVNTLQFLYDNNGVMGVEYGGETYIYRRNVQGDITALLDSSGVVMVKYVYDAWGKHKVLNPDGSELADRTHIGNLNPYRYRGYYYDVETGLYFLKTRYYDPETGRFITIDDLQYLNPETINGLNLYAYCANNPVMNVDSEGTWSWSKFWRAVGLAFTAVAAIAISIATFGAATPLAMTIVAGVTLAAGILTGINAVATFVEAGTGYNFVRDGIFQGNTTAYNWYEGITEAVAIIGSSICGGWLKANQPRIKAYKNVSNYNYTNTTKSYFPNADVVAKGNKLRPYMQSTWAQQTIIKYGKMIKDPFGYKFVYKNAELGVNIAKELIWHMLIK